MKVRIKFQKYGAMKFIGHLDVMRYFQKAIRRAEIPIAYSKGFSPHQIISFAAPLGVGLTSEGEYFDIQLAEMISMEEIKERLNKEMSDGFFILECAELEEKGKNAMSLVAAADYNVSLKKEYREKYDASFLDHFDQNFMSFIDQKEINIVKKTKKSEKEVNIRPLIYIAECLEEGTIFMRVASGSAVNLKPELVLQAFCEYCHAPYYPFAYQVHRREVYGERETDGQIEYVSLLQLAKG